MAADMTRPRRGSSPGLSRDGPAVASGGGFGDRRAARRAATRAGTAQAAARPASLRAGGGAGGDGTPTSPASASTVIGRPSR